MIDSKKIIVKNLTDGNIYTAFDIARIVDEDLCEVSQVINDSSIQKTCGDGSGVIYYSDIRYNTIVDGDGFRNTIYAAGCDVFCRGCHNPELWDVENGNPVTINSLLRALLNSRCDVTFSGGECSLQANAFAKLARELKEAGKNIWLYSGHRLDTLIRDAQTLNLLKFVDVLVDGPYIEEEKDLDIVFRGSKNQRIIDLNQTFQKQKIVEVNTCYDDLAKLKISEGTNYDKRCGK